MAEQATRSQAKKGGVGEAALRRLRLRLTLVCAIGTTLVLLGMAVAGLQFSLRQLQRQHEEAFSSSLSSIFFYLQAQPVIDQAWLAKTEAEGGLHIDIQSNGVPLNYNAQNPQRQQLAAFARDIGVTMNGYVPGSLPRGQLEPNVILFNALVGEQDYRMAVCRVPYKNGVLDVTVAKSRAPEQETQRSLYLGYGVCVAAGAVLLSVFAFVFCGRAMRPVAESQRRQTRFVSAASHELRSPLAVIRMSAGTIAAMPAQAAACAEQIEEECGRMGRLIEDLLLLASADTGEMPVHLAPADGKTLALSAFERFEALAAQKGLALEADIPEAGGQSYGLLCDAGRIQQVLAVFLDNALAYTPAGGRVRLCLAARRGWVDFTVQDSGIGIPEEDRQRIFERFYRADAARSHKGHYGLGLNIAQEIARLHRGKIAVGSSPLGGAAFTLSLPAARG